MNLEELKQINGLYHHEHILSEKDVEMVNKYIKHIENTRNNTVPKAGDIVEYTDKHGNYYPSAHIDGDGWEENSFHICEKPYTPFITRMMNDGIRMSTSGGAWASIPKDKLLYKGTAPKLFCDWGTCGPCAHGAVDFIATVNVWEYKEPEPLFGDYSTKDYRKMHFTLRDTPSDFGYFFLGNFTAFKTQQDYDAFKRTYRAKTFSSPYRNNEEILFYYKEEEHYIPKDDWENLKGYEIDTRLCNGSIITVKVKYDDENKKVITYRYSNRFEPEEEIAKVPYILNRIKGE